jgi:hypothetical protein
MTEDEWIKERATVIDGETTDVTPALPRGNANRRGRCAAAISAIEARNRHLFDQIAVGVAQASLAVVMAIVSYVAELIHFGAGLP